MGRLSLVIAVVLSLSASACAKKKGATPAASDCATPAQAKGFALSPVGFPGDFGQLIPFFEELKTLGDASGMWNGAWRDDATAGSDAGVIPVGATTIHSYSSSYCFVPIPVFGWRAGATLLVQVPGNTVNDWTNTDAKNAFKSMLEQFAAKKPPYVFLGNENNFYYEQSASGYTQWLTVYNELYDAVKAVSPATLVGPVLNFEHLAGSGALNGWTTPHWQALDNHNLAKVDVLGVTLYPFFQHANAADVPATYLDSLFTHFGTTKPIVITETGWPAENSNGLNPAWNVSAQQQVDFVPKLFAMLDGRNVPAINWLFLNGMSGTLTGDFRIFGSVSVRDSAGTKRAVYDAWAAR